MTHDICSISALRHCHSVFVTSCSSELITCGPSANDPMGVRVLKQALADYIWGHRGEEIGPSHPRTSRRAELTVFDQTKDFLPSQVAPALAKRQRQSAQTRA